MNCQHELYSTKEEYISKEEVKITMECSLCQTKFKGVLKKEDEKRM